VIPRTYPLYKELRMKVSELVAFLSNCNPDAIVMTVDGLEMYIAEYNGAEVVLTDDEE
jgi:hypothetical protein